MPPTFSLPALLEVQGTLAKVVVNVNPTEAFVQVLDDLWSLNSFLVLNSCASSVNNTNLVARPYTVCGRTIACRSITEDIFCPLVHPRSRKHCVLRGGMRSTCCVRACHRRPFPAHKVSGQRSLSSDLSKMLLWELLVRSLDDKNRKEAKFRVKGLQSFHRPESRSNLQLQFGQFPPKDEGDAS